MTTAGLGRLMAALPYRAIRSPQDSELLGFDDLAERTSQGLASSSAGFGCFVRDSILLQRSEELLVKRFHVLLGTDIRCRVRKTEQN